MNDHVWAAHLTAPLAIAAGILICLWGYRILKISLGLIGLIAGAAGGWALGSSMAHGGTVIALGCAVVAGVLGAVLCLWLYFLGVFALGASAGAIVAAGLFSATGHPTQPILIFVFAVIFGVLALLLQKLMIIMSTAFTGAYLITAGILPLVSGARDSFPMWFNPAPSGSLGMMGYAALILWLVLGLTGVGFQYRTSRKQVEVKSRAT